MGLLNIVFGWGRKIRKYRKKWDRLREKALKKQNPLRRLSLERLDVIENNLRVLEEQQNLDRITKARLSKDVELGLEEIKALLKSKPEELTAFQGRVRQQNK